MPTITNHCSSLTQSTCCRIWLTLQNNFFHYNKPSPGAPFFLPAFLLTHCLYSSIPPLFSHTQQKGLCVSSAQMVDRVCCCAQCCHCLSKRLLSECKQTLRTKKCLLILHPTHTWAQQIYPILLILALLRGDSTSPIIISQDLGLQPN